MAVVGIDLGTTNSLVCVWRNHKSQLIPNNLGAYLTPSVVGLDDNGDILVGEVAKQRLITHPDLTVASFKRFMGTNKVWKLGKQKFLPEELSALVLKKLIEDAEAYLGEKVEEVIISVPAYFNDDQRWATKAAGGLAGVKVERLINEPSAAAMAVHMDDERDSTYLVIDFGGGTLDVSVVDAFDNIIEIVAVSGDNHLGGDDFNKLIYHYFLNESKLVESEMNANEIASLKRIAEVTKKKLSIDEETTVLFSIKEISYELKISRKTLISLSLPLFKRLEKAVSKALNDTQMNIDRIDQVILVGGTCKMPIIQDYVMYITNRKVDIQIDPDQAIALGCGAVVGIKERSEDIKDVLLTDICPFSLGIGCYIEGSYEHEFSAIIERNSILPCSKENRYYTIRDNQLKISVCVYQGESLIAEENLKLGDIEINVPKNKVGEESILVRLTYDLNGILEVDVTSTSTGETKHLLILSKSNRMKEDEINQRIKELSKLKTHPRDEEKNKLLLERGKRLFMEATGETREQIGLIVTSFIATLNKQNKRNIQTAYVEVEAFLKKLENDENDGFKHYFEA